MKLTLLLSAFPSRVNLLVPENAEEKKKTGIDQINFCSHVVKRLANGYFIFFISVGGV